MYILRNIAYVNLGAYQRIFYLCLRFNQEDFIIFICFNEAVITMWTPRTSRRL